MIGITREYTNLEKEYFASYTGTQKTLRNCIESYMFPVNDMGTLLSSCSGTKIVELHAPQIKLVIGSTIRDLMSISKIVHRYDMTLRWNFWYKILYKSRVIVWTATSGSNFVGMDSNADQVKLMSILITVLGQNDEVMDVD